MINQPTSCPHCKLIKFPPNVPYGYTGPVCACIEPVVRQYESIPIVIYPTQEQTLSEIKELLIQLLKKLDKEA